MNLLSNLQQNEKVDGECFFLCWSWSCLFHCLLDKTLFPSGTQSGISSQVRTMENDKVVRINLAYDFKCWRMSFQSSVSDSFNQYFVHYCSLSIKRCFLYRLIQLTLRRNGHYLLIFQNYSLGMPTYAQVMLHKIPMVNISGTVMATLQPHITFNFLLWHHFYFVLATAVE